MSRIMLLIATRQNAANILPLSEPSLRPDVVCIAVTEEMRKSASDEDLRKQVQQLGIKVEDDLVIGNELDVAGLEHEFSQWLLDKHAEDEVIINLCGGLKTMTVAAYKVFSSLGARIFYGHYDGRIIWLDQPVEDSFNLSPNIRLPAYLKTYHYDITDRKSLSDIPMSLKAYARDIHEYLQRHFESGCNALSHLNYVVMPLIKELNDHEWRQKKSGKSLSEPSLTIVKPAPSQALDDFSLALPSTDEVFTIKRDKLSFSSAEAARTAGGGWLDLLVAEKLRAIPEVRDISIGVNFEKSSQRSGKAARNELDVMALAGTALLIVECKTVNWEKSRDASPLEAIYKLAALANVGGLNTRPLFVSLYDLPDSAITRARENGIELISGKRLLELPALLSRWVRGE